MKLTVVSANGKAGNAIVNEALSRDWDVTAIVRGENRTAAPHAVVKDIMDLTAEDLQGYDAVVDAFGTWAEEDLPQHSTTLFHLADLLSGTETRFLVVGGAGSLYVDPEHTETVSDGPDFPPEFQPLARAMGKALTGLRKRDDVRWTYVSPDGTFDPDGPRTGGYLLGGEELLLNEKGESYISYADYAIAVADELQNGDHIRERISVVQK